MGSRILGFLADSGPVLVLAVIAAAGSFTHIRDTANEHGQHGWMAWAIAVCIDLTCVMAAGERRRDLRIGRDAGPLSWPTVVLIGGILLSLAANLAQAEQTVWGWLTSGTPASAFLVAVSMLERRTTTETAETNETTSDDSSRRPAQDEPSPLPVPALRTARTAEPERASVEDERPAVPQTPDTSPSPGPAPQLLAFARQVADEHAAAHGRPITRDALRARLGVSNRLASDLLTLVRTTA